jgi:HlyD family secretion protein
MSATASSTKSILELEQPTPAPAQPDGPEPSPRPRRSRVLWIVAAIIVLALGGLTWRATRHSATSTAQAEAETVATVQRGDFVRTVRLNGTVQAVNFMSIAAPRLTGPGLNSLVVTKLAASGSRVKKGDLLVLFDRQQQIKNALDQEATYVDFVQQIKKKQADQATAIAADETALRQAENDVKSAAAEMRRNEILSKIDAEKNKLNYDQAQATLAQLKKTFELKRQSNRAELKSLEIQRDRAKSAMEFAKRNTSRLEIHAPMDGIVVLTTIWKGGQMGEVQEGDEVRAGQPFLMIINQDAMEVRARVNQADVSNLTVGQPVRIGLDAYPELSFNGKVERIAAIGTTSGLSEKVRTFSVLFSVQGTDVRLMPDRSGAVDVQLQRMPNSLVVPRDAVIASGSDHYVMVKDGASWTKKPVTIDAQNDLESAVGGIEEGTRVLRNANR